VKQPLGPTREPGVRRGLPHLSDDGQGVNTAATREPGVIRGLPHLSNDGRGVNRPQTREPGVSRDRPHLGDNGQGVARPQTREPGVIRDRPEIVSGGRGVNRPQTREPGVIRGLPHLSNDGRGVNRPQTREPGVSRNRPFLSNNGRGVVHGNAREPGVKRNLPHLTGQGRGVNHPDGREPGVSRNRPHLTSDGQGVNRPQAREPGVLDPPGPEHGLSALDDWGHEYHDLVMPELVRWFRHLAARLRHVRILNGDWSRLVTTGAAWTLPVRSGHGPAGVFLDPPYTNTERASGLYAEDDGSVAAACREWALEVGDNPKWRIVLAGYDTEHDAEMEAAGWTCHEWFASGYLTGGMGNVGADAHQQDRERLWASPHCVPAERALSLF
jgi:hypothetical protein